MKSIKPGRGPSMMGGIGAVFAALFGVVWTVMAYKMGAPIFFCLFGVFFIVMAIVQAVYGFKNASRKSRYSLYDITDDREEPDPFNERFRNADGDTFESGSRTVGQTTPFCPFCGAQVPDSRFEYCPSCGKKLPRL